MKLLIIGPPPAIGGTEIFLSRLVPLLRNEGIAIKQLYVDSIRNLWHIVGTINDYNPDIIHYFLPRPYVVGSMAARLARHKCKYIMSRRSLRDCYSHHWIEELFHSRVDAFIANSNAVAKELSVEVGHDPCLIHTGVDVPFTLTDPSPNFFTIACLADRRPYKGLSDFVAAVKLCQDRLPKPLSITTTLSQADIFVLPSHTEGFSNALLEAMALGLPCIATCVGGNVDAIDHGISGILVAPRHPFDLAEAIVTLANDLPMRRRLSVNARNTIRQHFTLDQCVDKHVALYQKVLNA